MPALLAGLAVGAAAGYLIGRGPAAPTKAEAWSDITGFYEQSRINTLKRDVASQELLIPEDYIESDARGALLRRPQVIERMQANRLMFNDYQQVFEDFRLYDTVVVMNVREHGELMAERNGPGAPKAIDSRYTDVWVHRRGRWERVVRHESPVAPTP